MKVWCRAREQSRWALKLIYSLLLWQWSIFYSASCININLVLTSCAESLFLGRSNIQIILWSVNSVAWCLFWVWNGHWQKIMPKDICWMLYLFSSFSIYNFLSQHKHFDAGFAPLQKKLSAIRAKLDLEKELKPDLLGKKTQLQRLQVHYSNVWLWYCQLIVVLFVHILLALGIHILSPLFHLIYFIAWSKWNWSIAAEELANWACGKEQAAGSCWSHTFLD